MSDHGKNYLGPGLPLPVSRGTTGPAHRRGLPPAEKRTSMFGRQINPPALAPIRAAVAAVTDPELHLPIDALGMLKSVRLNRAGEVVIDVRLTTQECPMRAQLESSVIAAAVAAGARRAELNFSVMSAVEREEAGRIVSGRRPNHDSPPAPAIYAIASGKGGVGKSSVAANLAVCFAQQGKRVALLDADVWGYSIPQLFGIRRNPIALGGMMLPLQAHGVALMSTGFLVQEDTPIVWRGPMLHKALDQFIHDVFWGELDVLVLDLPPGTGDVTLSVLELLPDASLVAVTTPQLAARVVAARVAAVAREADMPIAGVIENMSEFICAHCHQGTEVFGSGGGAELAAQLGVPLLGRIPLDLQLRVASDNGTPVTVESPHSPSALALQQVAARMKPVRRPLVRRPLGLTVTSSS